MNEEKFVVPTATFTEQPDAYELRVEVPGVGKEDAELHMDGKTVFRFTARAVPDAIDGVLHRAGMDISQVDWIVPHQANMRILDMVIRRYGLPAEKVFSNLDRVGNTSSASVPICLDEMRRQGLLKDGQTAIFVGFGGGLTYGAVLIRL